MSIFHFRTTVPILSARKINLLFCAEPILN